MRHDKSKPKVFISQPMSGKSTKNILKEREYVTHLLEDMGCYVITNILDTDIPELDTHPLTELSCCLYNMASADLVVFMLGHENARGCKIEFKCCDAYDIPHIDEYDLRAYGDNAMVILKDCAITTLERFVANKIGELSGK